MKKHFIKFALLLSLLLSVSCKNLFENSVNSDEDKIESTGTAISTSNPAPEKRTCVQLSGRLEYNNSGALPSEINSILENTNSNQISSVSSERSANPSIPTVTSNADCQYEYYIKATPNSGQAREEIAILVDGAWKYNITLEIGKTWTFEAGLRKKAQGTFGEDDYVGPQTLLIDFESDAGHPFSQALTETTTNIEKTFILKPRQNGGYGKIDLAMKKVPSTVNQMIIKIYDSNGTEQTALLGKLEYGIDSSTDEGNFIQSVSEGDNEYIFPSGIYDFVITFSQGYGTDPNRVYFPVYTTTQTVAVFDNMTTSVWKNGNSSASYSVIDSSGNFELTSNILQHYANTTLYVGKFSDAASEVSNSNSGLPFEPLETLTGAFNKIQANQNLQTGSDTYAYRIILCENQTGNFEIPAAITASKVSSIDISGYNNTQKVLNGNNSGTVLEISSDVPVKISHLQITGGNAAYGGGIKMTSGTKLTLGEGALVGKDVQTLAGAGTSDHGNYATGFGAGIYVENATLILKNGSKVCNNYLDSSAVLSGGGGIALCGGSLTIENGAAVSWNKSVARAGGIMVPYTATTASTITMKGGEISHNEAGRYGGGVIIGHTGVQEGGVIYPVKTFNFTGGTISENNVTGTGSTPSRGGAGVFFDGGSFTMSGNAVIEKNTASGCGGGISISASGEASGTFTMTGGIIRNNSAGTGGAIYFDDVSDELSEKSYSISGSASIPYGVDGTQGNGKNDVYIGKTGSLEIAAALNDTFPDTGIYSNNWKRGTPILKLASGVTVTESFVDKLKCTFPSDDWEKIISTDKVSVNCPFYVGSYNGTAGLDTNPGTKISPYATIEKACQQMTDKDTDYIIKIIGTTATEQQKIPAELKKDGSGTYNANSIKLLGADSSAVINRGLSTATSGSDDGTALLIESPVPVFLSNLKITGGFSSTSGGGIQLNSGTELHIESGTVIESNKATSGGAGIYNAGTLYITSGEIKLNSALGSDASGGGLYNGGTANITGGTFTANNAVNGGAIATFTSNTSISADANIVKGTDTAESPLNDIYVWSNCKLKIPSDITKHDSSSNQIAIKISQNTVGKGLLVLEGDGVGAAYQKFDLTPGGFKFDSEGKCQLKNIVTSIYVAASGGVNPSQPYGTSNKDLIWNNYTDSYNAYTSNQSKPFASIDKALQFITYQESASDYTIYLTGNFTQTSAALTKDNGDTNNPIKLIKTPASGQVATATSLTITGASDLSSGAPQDIVNSYVNSSTYNTTFNITTDVPVTFKKLHIQGGYAVDSSNSNGGGIKIASGADVTLDEYTFVHDNYAKCGAGIFNEGKLTVKTNTKIYGNTRDKTGGSLTLGGGGIYNNGANAKVYIEGGAIYSNSAANNSASGGAIYNGGGSVFIYGAANLGAQDCTNAASNGGAIYNAGYLYLGYKSAGTGTGKPPVNSTDSWTGKIQYNMASNGAGIYNAANSYVYMKAGEISNNVQQGSSTAENVQGLGVWNAGYFQMSSGYIQNHKNNTRYGTGAGVFINKNGTFEMTGGYIKENYIVQRSGSYKGKGGAVYNKGRFIIRGGANLPYGATINDTFTKEAGCNDVFLADQTDTSTEGDSLKPAGQAVITVGNVTSSPAAAISLPNYGRGKVVLTALTSGNGSISDLTNYISKIAITQPESDSEWKNEVYTDKTMAYLNAPIYVKGSGGASTNDGASLSKAVTSLANAESIITAANNSLMYYEIIISGEISLQNLSDSINGKSSGITIRGNTGSSTDMIKGADAKNDNAVALRILTSVPVTIKKLKITGAQNKAGRNSQDPVTCSGGGINIASGADVTLSDGVLVQGNKSKYGAGISNNGTLTLTGSGNTDDTRCVIRENEASLPNYNGIFRFGGGINNAGILNIEGYALIENNSVTGDASRGGAIYNTGTLNMKGNFLIPAGDSNDNDIYIAKGKPITITGSITTTLSGDEKVAKLMAADDAADGDTLLQKGDSISNSTFTNAVAKFGVSSLFCQLQSDGTMLARAEATSENIYDILNAVSSDGQTIYLTGAGNGYGNSQDFEDAINALEYKIKLDVSGLTGHCSLGNFSASNITDFTLNASITDAGIRTAEKPDMVNLYIKGNATLATGSMTGYNGLVNGECCKNDTSLTDVYYVNATTATIYYGFSQVPDNTEPHLVTIHIPTTVTKLIFQNTSGLKTQYIKIQYEGTKTQLKSKLPASSGIELGSNPNYAASYTFYCDDGELTWSTGTGGQNRKWE